MFRLPAEAQPYALRAALPANLPAGEYQVFVHSGFGGAAGWSAPAKITVAKPAAWPSTTFNVRDFGAVGDGKADDTPAVQAALAQARGAGGGIVTFPCGRYQVNETLEIPPRTVLRGEGQSLSQVFWPGAGHAGGTTNASRLPCALRGSHDFGVEDLTLWFISANNGLVADTKGEDAGNVFLRRVRMQWLLYGGYITILQANEVFRQSALDGGAGAKGALLTLGGRNVEVTDCDLESSGCGLWLWGGRGCTIARNRVRIGRLGYCFVVGGERLVFEENAFEGADNMARSAVFFHSDLAYPLLSRVYFAGNRLSDIWANDRECMSTDGASGQYFGGAVSSGPAGVALPAAQTWKPNQMAGHTLFVVGGRGKGQWRLVAGNTENTLTLDRPLDVPLDATSVVAMNHSMDRFLVVGNDYRNTRIAFQFYGTGTDSIVAENTAARSGGFWSHASHYAGPPARGSQPQFAIQYLNNHLTEGNYVHSLPAGYQYGDGDSVVGVGAHPSTNADGSPWRWPMALGFVLRGNRLDSNGRVRVVASANASAPLLEDAIVEGNHVARSRWGVDVSANCARVLVRNNTFDRVRRPLSGEGIAGAGIHPAALMAARLEGLKALAYERYRSAPASWPGLAAEAVRLQRRPAGDPALAGDLRNLFLRAWAELARWHPEQTMEMVETLTGLAVTDPGWQKGTLHRLLHEGKGGLAEWPLTARLPADAPALHLEVTPRWPNEWSSPTPTVTVALSPGKETDLPLPVAPPAGAWGSYSVPLSLRLSGEGLPPLKTETALTVGTGVVLEFARIGPFANREGAPVDATAHPPETRLDLGDEVDALGGKARWQPVRARNLDFAALYKVSVPATAYAVTCLRATEDVRATLLIGGQCGLRAWLNGEELEGFAGRPGQVTAQLKAGDNILLMKVSSLADGKWRLDFLNVDEVGARVGGRVRVVPTEELDAVPALNPPPLPATKPVTGLLHPGGVAWRLLHEDEFDGGSLAPAWRQASGAWKVADGVLYGEGPRAFLALGQKVALPVRIEFDARSKEPGDLSAFWLDSPPEFDRGVLVGFASNGNSTNKIVVDNEEVAAAEKPLAAPGKWHFVIAQILPDGRIQLFVDGQPALEARSKLPAGARFAGLWTWSQAEFRTVRVYGQ